jgi:predicted  nucleic acid-binding Zn-ribbon protein
MADDALAVGDPLAFGGMPVPPAKKGLFGSSKPASGPSAEMMGVNEQINGLSARIRVSEERFNELRKKLLFIEQNMLSNHKKLVGDLKQSNSEIDELRHKLVDVEDRIITVIKELRLTARKSDVDVMKRYIELWEPVKFVTADFAEKIAREVVEEKLNPQGKDQNI